jgi:hypothetical protein
MITKQKRKSPLACRPDPQHKWLYQKVKSEKKKLGVKSNSSVIQHILVKYFTEPA